MWRRDFTRPGKEPSALGWITIIPTSESAQRSASGPMPEFGSVWLEASVGAVPTGCNLQGPGRIRPENIRVGPWSLSAAGFERISLVLSAFVLKLEGL